MQADRPRRPVIAAVSPGRGGRTSRPALTRLADPGRKPTKPPPAQGMQLHDGGRGPQVSAQGLPASPAVALSPRHLQPPPLSPTSPTDTESDVRAHRPITIKF